MKKHPHVVGNTLGYKQTKFGIEKHPHVVGNTFEYHLKILYIEKHPHVVGNTLKIKNNVNQIITYYRFK